MTEQLSQTRVRLAASSYLNSAPLIWSFLHGSLREQVSLLTDPTPARCAEMLKEGAVDAALVPAIECQRLANISVVPNVCVGARERVRSVVLVTRGGELREVETVALDTSSRTSVALVEIIFREFLKQTPRFVRHAPDLQRMLAQHDAALLIGDPALSISRTEFRVFDLVEVWREFTGLGFVFALWAKSARARTTTAADVDAEMFARARDEGTVHARDIAREYARTLSLPFEDLYEYLTQAICFSPDAEMRAGLQMFYNLAYKHRLIETLQTVLPD